MANTDQNTTLSNNPLFDKMCQRFQFPGHVSVAEVMLKKAARYPARKLRTAKYAYDHREPWKVAFTRGFVRNASICCSILLLVSVLMICAIFGTSSNQEFPSPSGIFAEGGESHATPADKTVIDTMVYASEGAEITVKTSSAELPSSDIHKN